MVYTSHCCYRGQRKHVPAAGIVKKQGHRFLLIFWWTPGKDFPNSPCQTGDPRQVTEPEMEAQQHVCTFRNHNKSTVLYKSSAPAGHELAGLRICYSCRQQPFSKQQWVACGRSLMLLRWPLSCFWCSGEASADLQAVALPAGGRSGGEYFGGFRKPFANYICQELSRV